ncbi:28 kDa ribonucleoprotein, chloroplastic [Euphorbia lathyris]|uniref:28 kDa ribonucleoprotein, chloroplastic n=1 Tax=Euphorbia lathyris TaxID=212925 RepID=UPI003313ACC7
MAATAAAASFSPSIHTLKCTNIKHFPSDSVFKFLSNRATLPSISHRSYAIESALSSVAISWRTGRVVSAAVAQEEAEVTTAPVEEEQQEVGGDETPEAEADPIINTKLYFGNLPYNVDSAQLAGIIQDYGNPELIEVLYDRDTGRSRGFAFVTMSSLEDCNTVIENLDGSQYMGRILRVNFSDKPKPKEPLYPETEHKLFVGNLSWSLTSESLAAAFQEYGNVVGARVLYDGDTGKSRGYGFVCYSTKTEMENALQSLNGVDLEGREIRISLAQGKKSYSSS